MHANCEINRLSIFVSFIAANDNYITWMDKKVSFFLHFRNFKLMCIARMGKGSKPTVAKKGKFMQDNSGNGHIWCNLILNLLANIRFKDQYQNRLNTINNYKHTLLSIPRSNFSHCKFSTVSPPQKEKGACTTCTACQFQQWIPWTPYENMKYATIMFLNKSALQQKNCSYVFAPTDF